MLSPADAAVVRRDPALPGLAVLLDLEALADKLQYTMGLEIEAIQATYTRYKPGTNCLVAYRTKTSEGDIDFYARAYHSTAQHKLDKAHQQAHNNGSTKSKVMTLDDLAVVIYPFPNDRKLGVLPRLFEAKARQHLLAKILPNHPSLWTATLQHLRYKPERRYVARLVNNGRQDAVFKVFASTRYPTIKNKTKAFNRQGVPHRIERLGHSDRHSVLVLKWLSGQPFDEAIQNPNFDLNMARNIGEALAEMHEASITCLPRNLREVTTLLTAGRAVIALYPQLTHQIYTLMDRLTIKLLDMPQVQAPVHGDFSADQVLLTDKGVVFLDFDRATYGNPALDLGSFLAHLEYDRLQSNLTSNQVATIRDRFLEGYGLRANLGLPPRINLYTAASLLQLAPHAFRSRYFDWPERTAAILKRVEEIADND